MLTNILIVFFIFLILYQAFLAYSSETLKREGLENEGVGESSNCSSSVLAYKNSGAIQLLQEQVNKLMGLDKEVKDISGNVATLTTQVNGLIAQQKQLVETKLPSSTPKITGMA